MNKTWTIYFLILAFVLVIFARRIFQSRPPTKLSVPSVSRSGAPESAPSASASPAIDSKQKTAAGPLKVPTLHEVRVEIRQDPHRTPHALIRFAKNIAQREDQAKDSPSEARDFFSELEDCLQSRSTDERVPPQAQALCLKTAEELARLYPGELKDRYSALLVSAPPETLQLRKAMSEFSK